MPHLQVILQTDEGILCKQKQKKQFDFEGPLRFEIGYLPNCFWLFM